MNSSKALNKGITWKITTILLKIVAYSFFAIFILIILYPLLWAFISSFKTTEEIIKFPLALPEKWTVRNFKDSIEILQLGEHAWNSLLFTITTITFTTTIGFFASYAFAKIKLKITRPLEHLFFIALLIPHQAIILPLFLLVNYLGLYNSKVSIIVIYCAINLPLAIYLMTGYLKKIPDSLIESASLDGAGLFKIIGTIVLPMAKPIVISTAVITALFCWNQFFIPLIFTSVDETIPLIVNIYKVNGCFCSEFGMKMPTLIYGSLPQIIIFIIFRKSILKGIGVTFS